MHFPQFNKQNHNVTSDDDAKYNCIAFAAGFTDRRMWPIFHPDFWWPRNVPCVETVSAFVTLFESHGYVICSDGSYEIGKEKIGIWTKKDGTPTHAARQLSNTKWASKLGRWYDIEHQRDAVSDGEYGSPHTFMSRDTN